MRPRGSRRSVTRGWAWLAPAALLASVPAACGGSGPAGAPEPAPLEAAVEPAAPAPVCPPCRMPVRPEYELIEVDGLRFGICNPRCGEIVRTDTARFAADALP